MRSELHLQPRFVHTGHWINAGDYPAHVVHVQPAVEDVVEEKVPARPCAGWDTSYGPIPKFIFVKSRPVPVHRNSLILREVLRVRDAIQLTNLAYMRRGNLGSYRRNNVVNCALCTHPFLVSKDVPEVPCTGHTQVRVHIGRRSNTPPVDGIGSSEGASRLH